MSPAPSEIYTQRRDTFAAEEARLARISFRYSVFRGILFLLFLVSLVVILVQARFADLTWWAGAAFWLVAFVAVLPWHDRVIRRQRWHGEMRRINEEGLWRLARDWKALPRFAFPEPEDAGRPVARDLNLFGHASLSHLLGTAHTPLGKTILADWLLHPAAPEEIARRQAIVAALAPKLELRQEVQAGVRPMEKNPPDLESFLRWAEGEPWMLRRPGLTWLARVLAVATPVSLLVALLTSFPLSVFLLLITVNLTISYVYAKPVNGAFDLLESKDGEFQLYADGLERIAGEPYLAEDLTLKSEPAHHWMAVLHGRVDLSKTRHSSYLHLPLQSFFLWDFHVLRRLEIWQREAGRHARRWLEALGRFEALSALAGLRFDHPDWSFPEVSPEIRRYEAQELGHPLIRDAQRVSNDAVLGPPGSFLLVTGSNMSGKSTFLRAVGVNAVLAQAGGPVCAASLRMPPVTLATSILVEDNLTEGVSFFMAELKRIQQIVAESDRVRDGGRVLLYLLDEILRGTNSYERQVAVRRVILHLLRRAAIGAVSTHDLQLAEVEELIPVCVPVHFRETLHPGGDPPMTFDYQMRPGVATTVNALKLMELVGLGTEA